MSPPGRPLHRFAAVAHEPAKPQRRRGSLLNRRLLPTPQVLVTSQAVPSGVSRAWVVVRLSLRAGLLRHCEPFRSRGLRKAASSWRRPHLRCRDCVSCRVPVQGSHCLLPHPGRGWCRDIQTGSRPRTPPIALDGMRSCCSLSMRSDSSSTGAVSSSFSSVVVSVRHCGFLDSASSWRCRLRSFLCWRQVGHSRPGVVNSVWQRLQGWSFDWGRPSGEGGMDSDSAAGSPWRCL